MARVEPFIFASAEPVLREKLALVVGKSCNLDLIVDDIKDELRGRPYEIVSVAGGWSFRTKLGVSTAIRTALGGLDSTFVSPGAIWVRRAANGLSCPIRSARRG